MCPRHQRGVDHLPYPPSSITKQEKVVKIHGKQRLEGVTIAKVDENRKPIEETKEFKQFAAQHAIDVDTILEQIRK